MNQLNTQVKRETKKEVVSIGHSCAFYVVLVPQEYILSLPPNSNYVMVICFVLLNEGSGLQYSYIYKGDDVNNSLSIANVICILTTNTKLVKHCDITMT